MSRVGLVGGVLAVLLLSVLLVGSVAADMKDNVTYQGNKARITIGKIKDKADHFSGQEAAAIGEMLSTALANNPKFIVLASQEEVDELIDEIELGESQYTEEGRGPEKGLMEGADILVTGAVTEFEPDAGGSGGGLGGLTKKAFGAVGVKKKEAQINMDIKLIDIRTRRIIKAMSLEGKATKWKTDMKGGGWTKDIAFAGGLSVYDNEPMGDAIRTVLAKAVEKLEKETPDEYYRYKGQGQYSQEYGAQTQTAAPSGSASGGQAASTGTAAATTTAASTTAAAPAAPAAEDMTLYTKYDFVPGDKVIFYDDMAGEEEGEFPYRWNLEQGVFEVVRLGTEYWIMCTDNGTVYPKIPQGPLPEQYTIELEFYSNGPDVNANYFHIRWFKDGGGIIGEFGVISNGDTWFNINSKSLASKRISPNLPKGIHTMRVMVSKRSMKCFVDEHRVANVPKVEGFNPVRIGVYIREYDKAGENPCLFRGLRFAEGGKTMREQLDETGKVVTHGILFDSDSYKIKAQSFKTLKDIGRLLEDDAGLRLSIEGHTDSDGDDAHNQTLSQNRAESVRNYLISKYSIAADRLEAKGWGEAQPIDGNTTPEGKANNRRVELIKL